MTYIITPEGLIVDPRTGEVLGEELVNETEDSNNPIYFEMKTEAKGRIVKIIELYRQGKSIKEIKETLGIRSTSLIYLVINQYGIKKRKKKSGHKKLTPEIKKRIMIEWMNGKSIYQIAKEWGLSTSRIYYIIHGNPKSKS